MADKFVLEFKPHHLGVSVDSLEDAIVWYQKVLGFEVVKRFELKKVPFKAAFVKSGEFSIELFEVDGANALPIGRRVPDEDLRTHGNKHLAFQVDDIDATFKHFKDAGVEIAMDVFPMDDEFGGFIRDNTGNLIEFVQV